MFEKGRQKTGGRKKGVVNKDTQNYLDFQLWFKEVWEDLKLIAEPEKRLPWIMMLIDKMMLKVQTLPGTPGESVKAAENAAAILKELENASAEPDAHS